MLTLKDVKTNLRIDTDEDDAYLTMLLDASKVFIMSTLELPETYVIEDPRFPVLQFMLVSNWFENRVPTASALQQQVPFTITAMIHQLRGVDIDG